MWMRTITNWNVPRMARSKQRRIRSEIGRIQERKPRRLSIAMAAELRPRGSQRTSDTGSMKQPLQSQWQIIPILSNWGRTLSASAGLGAHLTSLALWRCNRATFGFLYLIVSHCAVVLQGVRLSMYEAFLHGHMSSSLLDRFFL